MKRLLICVSGHGLGHLAQVAPIIRVIAEARPDIAVSIRTSIPAETVRARVGSCADIIPADDDFGVRLCDGFEVDLTATRSAYAKLHAEWPSTVAAACDTIAQLAPDLLLANVGHIPIAAGVALGIPSYGLASLDWYTILKGYPETQSAGVLDDLAATYARADGLLEFTPSSARAPWRERCTLGPVAAIGRDRRHELRRLLQLTDRQRIVLCAFGGGVPFPPATDWHLCPETIFLAPAAWCGPPSVIPLDRFAFPFTDLVASSDACLAKLGYGIAVEAIFSGTPLLYHRRQGWAEDDELIAWVHAHGRATEINLGNFNANKLNSALASFSDLNAPTVPWRDTEDRLLAFLAKHF